MFRSPKNLKKREKKEKHKIFFKKNDENVKKRKTKNHHKNGKINKSKKFLKKSKRKMKNEKMKKTKTKRRKNGKMDKRKTQKKKKRKNKQIKEREFRFGEVVTPSPNLKLVWGLGLPGRGPNLPFLSFFLGFEFRVRDYSLLPKNPNSSAASSLLGNGSPRHSQRCIDGKSRIKPEGCGHGTLKRVEEGWRFVIGRPITWTNCR